MSIENSLESPEIQPILLPSEQALCAAQRIRTAITSCDYGPVRSLTCQCQKNRLCVCGRVPTYFMKQVAIELLRQHLIDGVECETTIDVK